MNLRALAEDYLRSAEVRIGGAKMALRTRDYPDVIRFSQEAVELSLKAGLRVFGVEYAKEHDVGEFLKNVSERFPPWFREEVDTFANISANLASKRAAAMYGLEIAGKAPSEIFKEDEARSSLEDARKVVAAVKKLMK